MSAFELFSECEEFAVGAEARVYGQYFMGRDHWLP